MMWFFFLHCESVMIGFGFLIQMRFTLSMVNRFYGVLKSNVFTIRKSILILVNFVLVAGLSVNRF